MHFSYLILTGISWSGLVIIIPITILKLSKLELSEVKITKFIRLIDGRDRFQTHRKTVSSMLCITLPSVYHSNL